MKQLSIILAAVIILSGAAAWWLNGVSDLHAERNQARQERLKDWQQKLIQAQKNGGTVRQEPVNVLGIDGGTRAVLGLDGPLPVKPNDTFFYNAQGNQFVMCGALDNIDQVGLFQSSKQAFFVTATGSFTAPADACRESLSPEVAALATATTMTEPAIGIFYRAKPAILDKSAVQKACAGSIHGKPDVQFAGCFTGTIYLLQITESGVTSEMRVTAAHEMLHAAYQRLSDSEQERLSQRLLAEQQRLQDQELNDDLALYDSADRPDELHARLATQIIDLSAELERYYGQYFQDRRSLAANHQAYRDRLNGLNAELESIETRLKAMDVTAQADLAAGRIAEYNRQVGPYNALLARYNGLVGEYNSLTAHTRPGPEQLPNR